MVGYIFKAENAVTKKVYIGKYYSVRFDKKHIGDNPGVISDAEKYGADKFTVNMIKACETVKDCDYCYEQILKELNAKSDINYYNCEKAPATKTEATEEKAEKPKKTRSTKKKAVKE